MRGCLQKQCRLPDTRFPANQHGGTGNGLRNMRERMDAAGGTLIVESAGGAGTRLVFRVPIGGNPSAT